MVGKYLQQLIDKAWRILDLIFYAVDVLNILVKHYFYVEIYPIDKLACSL